MDLVFMSYIGINGEYYIALKKQRKNQKLLPSHYGVLLAFIG